MNAVAQTIIDVVVLVIILAGIARFQKPQTARGGNLLVACALLLALATELVYHPPRAMLIALVAFSAGSLSGWISAARVTMTQIPALVGLQNGAGGLASCLVSLAGLTRASVELSGVTTVAALFGLAVGATTFAGSMVASGKLAGWLRQSPLVLRWHMVLLSLALAAIGMLALGVASAAGATRFGLVAATTLVSALLGILVAMRVGGADMPVLISLLNALSGLSAGLVGVVVESRVLTACGATVAASGLLLTHAMCRAMNRSLPGVLFGSKIELVRPSSAGGEADGLSSPAGATSTQPRDVLPQAIELLRAASKVIVVPGYGMALAQAQSQAVQLATRCQELGKDVKFAIHPLAGRMPGHMHVLLAEAEIDPDMLFDLNEVNEAFATADLVIVVGACDVVNPAAVSVPGTPISGMPILTAHDARHVLVCNLDAQPGYSGVDNPLYRDPKTLLLLGDAALSVTRLLEELQ